MKDLKDKVALVTGAASGIGQALAIGLAQEGAQVVLADVNEEGMEDTRQEIEKLGGKALAVRADVADAQDVKALCDKAVNEMGGVDILANVAGIGISADISDMEIEDWNRILGINLFGPIHTINCLLNQMVERGSGHIVNVASGCGLVALPTLGGYNTSKFGLVGLSETLRAETARHGIGVTVVCPGAVKTNIFNAAKFKNYDVRGLVDVVVERFGWTPERVARLTIKGMKRNRALLALSPMTWMAYYTKRIFPPLMYWIQKIMVRYLTRYKAVDSGK